MAAAVHTQKVYNQGCILLTCVGKNEDVRITADGLNNISLAASSENTPPTINIKCKNDIRLSARCKNKRIMMNVGLICGTGLGQFLYLEVTDGFLMSITDGYLLVKKHD